MSTVALAEPRAESRAAARTSWLRRRALRLAVFAYLALLVGLPIAYLLVAAFSPGLPAFWHAVTSPALVSGLALSAKIAVVVVPLNTIACVGAALLLTRRRFVGARLLDLTFDVPIAVSPIIIGAALVFAYAPIGGWFGPWLAREGIQLVFSPAGVALVSMAVSLPYVLRSILPVLVELGDAQEAAARTLGAGPWRRFATITLPAIRWGLLYGVVLTLARTLGEFGAVLIVSGNFTSTQTLPLVVWNEWDQSLNSTASYAGAVVLAAISVVALVVMSLLRSKERRQRVDLP